MTLWGVTLYNHRRENAYIQSIDLSRVRFWSTYSYAWEEWTGEPTYQRRKLIEHAKWARLLRPISIINGQFFDPSKAASPLSFSLRENGITVTRGADNRGERKNILSIGESWATIVPYTEDTWNQWVDSFAIVNLDPTNPRSDDTPLGRTFLCIPRSEGRVAQRLIILIAESYTKPQSLRELWYWWCDPSRTSMLDSSGSSQFWMRGITLYGFAHAGKPDYRTLPHAIVLSQK